MSFKRKHVSCPTNQFIFFRDYTDDEDFFELKIKKIPDEDLREKIYSFINENLDYERRGNHRYFLLAKTDLNHFLTEIDNLEKGIKNSDDSSSSDGDTSTEDELIQTALNRRLVSESTQDVISNNIVSDSDMEDVLSISRRLRYILNKLTDHEKRLSSLE